MRTTKLLLCALMGCLVTLANAQVPNLLNYQGRIAVENLNFDGSGQFKFALVNAAADVTYWSNDGTSTAGSQPMAAVALPVSKGLYSVLLGDTALSNMTALTSGVFNNPVWLRVWFNDGTHGFQLLAPDQRVVPGPQGPPGPAGPSGSGGSDFIYGDGSAGAFVAPVGESTLEVSNPQFTTLTVDSGRTLRVPSGMTIRCTGNFINHGTIIVEPAGGLIFSQTSPPLVHSGIAKSAPSRGEAGVAFQSSQLKALFHPGLVGGGSGFLERFNAPVAKGGGTMRVFAKGSLETDGELAAPGEAGVDGVRVAPTNYSPGGGGGGGIIILASANSIIAHGLINIRGGNGGAGFIGSGVTALLPGGGGGGGLLRLLAPTVSNAATVWKGGANGTVVPPPAGGYYGAYGPGGGASGGTGGVLVATPPSNESFSELLPSDGLVIIDECNPAALLLH